ncbi:unnamed protein product, partial [Choristocarpus tenellus]
MPRPSRQHNYGGGDDILGRLSSKIRLQASELANLTEKLQQQAAYSRLVEGRLLQLDPHHPLPITPSHLSQGKKALGRRHSGEIGEEIGGEQEGDDHSRRGYEVGQERLKDAVRLIKQLREALETRDSHAKAADEHVRALQRETSDLRKKLSLEAGNVGSGGRGRDRSGGKASEARDVLQLQRGLSRLKQKLRVEQGAADEARSEASALRDALEDMGMGPGGGGVITELVETRNLARELQEEVSAQKGRVLCLEEELKETQSLCSRLQKDLAATGTKKMNVRTK